MSSALSVLLEMGFSQTKAERALDATGNSGVEQAMEWLLTHADEPDSEMPSIPVVSQAETENIPSEDAAAASETKKQGDSIDEATDQEAKSLKCDDCGKLFKNDGEVEFHATKTGHMNFSETTEEVKPLTEEEKRDRIRLLEDRIKQRRLEKEAQERREQIEREKQRRKVGQEIVGAKKKLEEEELKRIADQRKKEKLEEKMARQRILEQIERDKQARREKFGGAITSPVETSKASVIPSSSTSSTVASSQKKDYDQTKIQIRLPSGVVLTQTFGSKEELAAVRLYIEMNQTDISGPFTIMTNFPKHIFTNEDMEKPLFDLGLVPSAVLIVSKKTI